MISKKIRSFFIPAILTLIVILGVVGVRSLLRTKVLVRTSTVSRQDLGSTVSTNGKVEPIQGFQAHAATPGAISHIYVTLGQQVATGTLLLSMDSSSATSRLQTARSTLAMAQASAHDLQQGGSQDERIDIRSNLDRARAQLDQANHDMTAIQELQSHGAASASEVAAAQLRLQNAQTSFNALNQRSTARYSSTDRQRTAAQLSDGQASVVAAEKLLQDAVIRAPFAGTVYALPVRQYDYVQAGDNLVSLADLNRVQVRAYFDEPEIGKLAIGQPVKVTWDAKSARAWHGHIVQIPTTVITYGTRNVGESIIAIDDAIGDLLPSTNVVVTVTTQQRSNVLSIPREALRTEGIQNYVFRIVKGKLVRTKVSVGVVNLTLVEIIGGLSEKDTVVLNAISNVDLVDGLAVEPAPQVQE
jgi:HlyD family secretion protein